MPTKKCCSSSSSNTERPSRAGEIVLSGNSEDLLHDDDVRKAYLGF